MDKSSTVFYTFVASPNINIRIIKVLRKSASERAGGRMVEIKSRTIALNAPGERTLVEMDCFIFTLI